MWDPELPPKRPRNPDRVQRFIYACGKVAAIGEGKMKDEETRTPRKPRATRRPTGKRVILPGGVEIEG